MELALRTPVFGWMVKDALYGYSDAKYYFGANLFLIFFWCIYFFGYPFIIAYALFMTVFGFTMLLILTSSDLFEQRMRRRPLNAKDRSELSDIDKRRERRMREWKV